MSQIVPLGTAIPPLGRIEAIASISGERYYFLIDKQGNVSMLPADVIEQSNRRSNASKDDE